MKPTDLDALDPEFDRCEVVIRGESAVKIYQAVRESKVTLFGRQWHVERSEITCAGPPLTDTIRLKLVAPSKIDLSAFDRLKA